MTIKLDPVYGITFPDGTIQNTGASSLGQGQSYQRLSISAGVTYTNSTGFPLLLVVELPNAVGNAVYVYVGGVLAAYAANDGNGTGQGQRRTATVLVCPKQTYQITGSFLSPVAFYAR